MSVRRAAAETGKAPSTVWLRRRRERDWRGDSVISVYGLDGKQYPAHRLYDLRKRNEAIVAMREQGMTLRRIAKESGWSYGTVVKVIAAASETPAAQGK